MFFKHILHLNKNLEGYLAKLFHIQIIILIVGFLSISENTYAQDFLTNKKAEISKNIINNDLKGMEFNLNQVFLKENIFNKRDLIDFYLYRIKLYNVQGKYNLIANDLDSIFKYDSTNYQAYLYKIPFINQPKAQIEYLQTAMDKVNNQVPIIKEIALIKIGVLETYIDEASTLGVEITNEYLMKNISYVKGGCKQLSEILHKDEEVKDLMNNKCRIEIIKNF